MHRFLFLLSILLLPSMAKAQGGMRIGSTLMGPVTKTWADGSSLKTNGQLGYHVGYYYQHKLTKRLSLVPEVQFSREQAQVTLKRYSQLVLMGGATYIGQTVQGQYRLQVSYVNLPVVARFALGPVYVEAGPQVSVLVGGQGKGQTSHFAGDGTYYTDIKQTATKRFRPFDAGACVGLGLVLPAGFGINIRAYQGIVNRDRDEFASDDQIPWVGHKTQRQTLQASLTYQFPSRS
jgi:hypothetical protein